jgi:nucleotide-binding universal stress UspA family protein
MLPFRRVLVPTDLSPESQQAFPVAREVARDASARLVLVHVLPAEPETPWEHPPYPDLGVPVVPAAEYLGRMRAEVTRRLDALAAAWFPETPCEVQVRVGDPAHELVRAAAEEGADVIVLATHGWTGWRKLLFGSVAERVLREAACPVLVVKCTARVAPASSPPPPV